MNALFKGTICFVLVLWTYVFYVNHSHAKRTATIEKIASTVLTCESDADCAAIAVEADFCGRAKRYVKVSKKNPRYDELVLLGSKNTTPGAMDKIARGFFRDCLSLSDSVKASCVQERCK